MKGRLWAMATLAVTLSPALGHAQSAQAPQPEPQRVGAIREHGAGRWGIHAGVTVLVLLEAALIDLADPPTRGLFLMEGIDPWSRARYSEGAAGASKAF